MSEQQRKETCWGRIWEDYKGIYAERKSSGGRNEQKTADGEGLGKLVGEEEVHKEKKWEKGGWLDGGKQLESEKEQEEVRWDVSRADGLRECRSKFHVVMSLQKQEM